MERLEIIMEAIEKINSNYISEFRKIETKKPKTRQIEIDDDFELRSVIEAAEGLPIVEKALEIFYSNKIAHLCRTAQKNMISDLTQEENEKNMGYESLMYRFSDEEMNRVAIFTHRYFIAKKSLNKKVENIAKRRLEKDGINQEMLNVLEERGYDVLSKTYLDCMAIKSETIDESVELLKKDENQSFGMAKVKNNKTGKEESLFVIDVPCFGQMSVHICSEELMTQLSDCEYKYPIYQTENVLLIDSVSKYQANLLKKSNSELIQELKAMKSREEAHEIAVKAGFNRSELEEIHGSKDEGEQR